MDSNYHRCHHCSVREEISCLCWARGFSTAGQWCNMLRELPGFRSYIVQQPECWVHTNTFHERLPIAGAQAFCTCMLWTHDQGWDERYIWFTNSSSICSNYAHTVSSVLCFKTVRKRWLRKLNFAFYEGCCGKSIIIQGACMAWVVSPCHTRAHCNDLIYGSTSTQQAFVIAGARIATCFAADA